MFPLKPSCRFFGYNIKTKKNILKLRITNKLFKILLPICTKALVTLCVLVCFFPGRGLSSCEFEKVNRDSFRGIVGLDGCPPAPNIQSPLNFFFLYDMLEALPPSPFYAFAYSDVEEFEGQQLVIIFLPYLIDVHRWIQDPHACLL